MLTEGTAECASKLPNAWGLFDIHGNVSEWCHSSFRNHHRRVLRGGSYSNSPLNLRIDHHIKNPPDLRGKNWGFRVAKKYP